MIRAAALVPIVLAAGCLMDGCGGPTALQAQLEVTATLDETEAAVAHDLPISSSSDPSMEEQCAWLPGWPTSSRAWQVRRSYLASGALAVERVQRTVAHAREQGGAVVYDRDDAGGGHSARIRLRGLDLLATADSDFELKIRSRCFTP